MALFGKKHAPANSRGVQAPNSKKEVPVERQKSATKSKANTRSLTSAVQTTYLGKNLKINGSLSGEGSLENLDKISKFSYKFSQLCLIAPRDGIESPLLVVG